MEEANQPVVRLDTNDRNCHVPRRAVTNEHDTKQPSVWLNNSDCDIQNKHDSREKRHGRQRDKIDEDDFRKGHDYHRSERDHRPRRHRRGRSKKKRHRRSPSVDSSSASCSRSNSSFESSTKRGGQKKKRRHGRHDDDDDDDKRATKKRRSKSKSHKKKKRSKHDEKRRSRSVSSESMCHRTIKHATHNSGMDKSKNIHASTSETVGITSDSTQDRVEESLNINNDEREEDANHDTKSKKKRSMMVPMTREQDEAQQAVVREVYDVESGRYRLVRGTGEIIERIVSRDAHAQINRVATRTDGTRFARDILSHHLQQQNHPHT